MTSRRQHKINTKPLSGPGSDRHKPRQDSRQGDRHRSPRSTRPAHSGKGGTSKTLFHDGHFVAWDGEGETLSGSPAVLEYMRAGGDSSRIDDLAGFSWHVYTSLSCGWFDGSVWHFHTLAHEDRSRLKTTEIFKFFLKINELCGPLAIHVGYYLGYDFVHILYDVDPEQALIGSTSNAKFPGWIGKYWFRFGSKRDLRVGKRKNPNLPDKEQKRSFHLWDIAGFFQSSFVSTVEKWLTPDYPDLPLLRQGKAGRGDFARWSEVDILAYNRAELQALVLVMDRFRESIAKAGYVISRWDGAGSLASALYKKHFPRGKKEESWFQQARSNTPDPVWSAATASYFGGRIEYIQYGVYQGYLWHGDINSAYPAGMITIPDLTRGIWGHLDSPSWSDVTDYALYFVSWFDDQSDIGFFPFRLKNRSVMFPKWGSSWVWGVELRAALELAAGNPDYFFQLHEAWVYYPSDPAVKPFDWITDLYALRQEAAARQLSGDYSQAGVERVLKYGLNSLYGKTVQRVGYLRAGEHNQTRRFQGEERTVITYTQADQYPPFFHPGIGAYQTAWTRAQLLHAASSDPDSVICFATDGIYSTRRLDVPQAKQKLLGLWTVDEVQNAQFVMVQPGVYYIHDGTKWFETIRGFSKASRAYQSEVERQRLIEERVNSIIDAYRSIPAKHYEACVPLTETRLITLKAALAVAWEWRGQFVTSPRDLKVYGSSDKRDTGYKGHLAPSKNLVKTRSNVWLRDVKYGDQSVSLPYDGLPPEGIDTDPADENDMYDLIAFMQDMGEIL